MTTVTDIFAAGLDQVRRSWGWFLVFGILLTLLGVLCVGKAQTATIFSILVLGWILAISGVLWLVNGAAGVTMLLASLFIVAGLFRAVGAGVIRFPRWGWTVFSGIVSVILGVSLLASWPSASTYFIGMVIGIDLIFDGASLIGFATAMRSLPETQIRKAA